MPNPIITLNNPATTAAQFDALLAPGDKTFFAVLGNSANHQALATAAQPDASTWRHVLLVTDPTLLYPKLSLMSTADVTPPVPPMPTWVVIAITFDGKIVDIATDFGTATANIIPFFIEAETL